jgi:hypothetical protein
MRIPSFVIYAGVIVLGALALSVALAFLDLDVMPWDIVISRPGLNIHISVLYSLGASVVLALLFWWWRK